MFAVCILSTQICDVFCKKNVYTTRTYRSNVQDLDLHVLVRPVSDVFLRVQSGQFLQSRAMGVRMKRSIGIHF